MPSLYARVSILPHGVGVWARVLGVETITLSKELYAIWVAARTVLTGETAKAR